MDFRVKARPDIAASDLLAAREAIADRFPVVEEMQGVRAEISLQVDKPTSASDLQRVGVIGYHYKSSDGRCIAQFRLDGFTFNHLPPYSSWEEMLPQVLSLWGEYLRVAKPLGIARLAVRYINQIPVPADVNALGELMEAPIPVPESVQYRFSNLVTRVTVHDSDSQCAAHIIQAVQARDAGQDVYYLDIDAFSEAPADVTGSGLTTTLDALRRIKNQIFFESLTDRTLERFE